MNERETVYVVVDHGEREESATVRGVYDDEEAAEERKEEIEHPFSWVQIQRSNLHK